MTTIEWTNKTWNPTRGCSIVSAGCFNCYAMKFAHRFSGPGGTYEGLTKLTASAGPQWSGVVRLIPGKDGLLKPLSWRTQQMVFVDSMSDQFHESVPDAYTDQVMAVIALTQYVGRCRRRECDHEGFSCEGHLTPPPRHVYQLLTKRPERMQEYMTTPGRADLVRDAARSIWSFTPGALDAMEWPLPNLWCGTSTEDQRTLEARLPYLRATPAAIRFISAEPLLTPLDLSPMWEVCPMCRGTMSIPVEGGGTACPRCIEPYQGVVSTLDWIIAGGESGPKSRRADLTWFYQLRDQTRRGRVPFFLKQLGRTPSSLPVGWPKLRNRKGGDPREWPEPLRDCRAWPEGTAA